MAESDLDLVPYGDVLRDETLFERLRLFLDFHSNLSYLMPSLRWGRPTYAAFAYGGLRKTATRIMDHYPPDRWWLIDAYTREIDLYARQAVMSFTSSAPWQERPPPSTIQLLVPAEEVDTQLEHIQALIGELAHPFFKGSSYSAATRQQLVGSLAATFPDFFIRYYHSLVPDFSVWLNI